MSTLADANVPSDYDRRSGGRARQLRRLELQYDHIETVLADRFPALLSRIAAERELWRPDPVGVDILLADVFVPYVLVEVRNRASGDESLRRIARFIDELAEDHAHAMREVARISILQALEDEPVDLRELVTYLGPAARSMLPTRTVGTNWA